MRKGILCSLKPSGKNVFGMAEASKRVSAMMEHGAWRVKSEKQKMRSEQRPSPGSYCCLFSFVQESFQKMGVVPKFLSDDFWKTIYIYNSSG